jgi:hypothetical protein
MNIADLLKDPNKAKEALKEAIKKKDKKLAETLIPMVKDPFLTYEYALKIVKGKIKDEWEDIIALDAQTSFWYAKYIIKGPFPKGEDKIAKWLRYAYTYANDILQGPFLKGEDTIAIDGYYSYLYAQNVLKDRFIKGEDAIIKNKKQLTSYIKFLKEIGKLDEFLRDHPEIKVQ